MHSNNKLIDGYHFLNLADEFPILKPFLLKNTYGRYTLDFSKRECIITFNKVLLRKYYELNYWDVPAGKLCPTVLGRADYLHYLHDLMGTGKKNMLDIGTGATIIYPLLGYRLFNWQFTGSEIDKESWQHAQEILIQNNISPAQIELRLQYDRNHIFKNIVLPTDQFDACICNPPFFESEEQALRWNQKKWKKEMGTSIGTHSELAYEGGEKKFIQKMIEESIHYQDNIKLFTCLVSKKSSIPLIEKSCQENNISSLHFTEMKTGRKVSRIAVWKI